MTALAAARTTPQLGDAAIPSMLEVKVKGSTHIYQGSFVGILAGYLVPMSANSAIVALGRAVKVVDNSAGSDGDLKCPVERGIFRWGNGSTLVQADVGKLCYASDDQTVAGTDALGTKPIAGWIVLVDASGVWVETSDARIMSVQPKAILSFPIDLVNITGSQDVVSSFTPGFAGRVLKADFIVNKPVTTGSKLATLQPYVGATSITGGAIALTSALATPMGANIAGSAITALNTFLATDTLKILASGVTAFSEGTGSVRLYLG